MGRSYEQPLSTGALRFRVPSAEQLTASSWDMEPNLWFAQKFPEQTARFGPAFMDCRYEDMELQTRCIPAEINTDFFAGILGGDPRLKHQVVFHPPEDQFYFFDYREKAFCTTTPAKLELLLSNYLIRCSQEMSALVEIRPLMTSFRKSDVLKAIVERSKDLLECDASFFQGDQGYRRLVDGRIIEPTAKPSYEAFVEKVIVREDQATLTVTDAFHRYYSFCKSHQMSPLTRQEFKALVTEVIREEFQLGLRKDVPGRSGGQTQGWCGLKFREELAAGLN